jgi:mannose-6-phosphate isomerase-like protein (cupin superfamily)
MFTQGLENLFETEEVKVVEKLWGHERQIVTKRTYTGPDGVQGYTGKILTVLPNGNACSVHYHRNKTETFFILEGRLFLELWSFKQGRLVEEDMDALHLETARLFNTGEAITLYPYTPHRFHSPEGICDFIEFSTPDDAADSYRIVPSGPHNR